VVDIPLARSDYFRGVAKEARIITKNRYYEQNPVLTDNQVALIARMGLKRWIYVGEGPIRNTYSQPGSFDDDLFVASYDQLYRVTKAGVVTLIGTIPGSSVTGFVSMAATSNIGTTPAFLFIAAGSSLMCYIEEGYAVGTITGVPANNDVVQVGTVYYKFTNASVDAGAPAGTNANPWLVALGASTAAAWQNLADAFGDVGIAGVQYSTVLTADTEIQVTFTSTTAVVIRSTYIGALGNATATLETGAAIAWGAATLTGGGNPSYFQVETPDDVGIISLGYIASYVVAVPAQGQGINGRFYWINPGETTIDALDFATAERAPDPVSGVVVFGDQFWLPGTKTTEVWYFTGNIDTPVLRMQGVVFDRGAWEGTAIQVKECMIIVDTEGAVFKIDGGARRISRPDIEERIRKAIQYQASLVP
jgi:hypothetical protein